MTTIESQLTTLENEAKALKATYAQSAVKLSVHQFSTSCATANNNGDDEGVIVIFNTVNNANTLATLSVTTDSDYLPRIRRANYSGGAKWVVSITPKNGYYSENWQATNLNFTVYSLIDGYLSAEAT